MSWDYLWKAGAKGAALTSLSDYALMVRQIGEIDTGRRGADPIIQYRHGSHHVRKWATPKEIMLEIAVRYTNSGGAVTHTDGAAGHGYENLAAIRQLLGGTQGGQATLQQTAPDWGTVQLDVEQRVPSVQTQAPWVYGFLLTATDPFWRSTSQGSSTGNPAVAGNAPVYPTIEFTGGGTNMKLTHSASGAYIQIDGVCPAAGVTVDCSAQTCIDLTGSTDYSAKLTMNKAYWLLLDPGANTMTRSGGGTVTVKWYDRWL